MDSNSCRHALGLRWLRVAVFLKLMWERCSCCWNDVAAAVHSCNVLSIPIPGPFFRLERRDYAACLLMLMLMLLMILMKQPVDDDDNDKYLRSLIVSFVALRSDLGRVKSSAMRVVNDNTTLSIRLGKDCPIDANRRTESLRTAKPPRNRPE
jgi:hypothetical protein